MSFPPKLGCHDAQFYMDTWDLSSGVNAGMAGILPPEPFPLKQEAIFPPIVTVSLKYNGSYLE